ncbi:MAG: acyltransferase [Bacteroidales bacterium]|nr:acyltransferase [Bacteroidales bacterium]
MENTGNRAWKGTTGGTPLMQRSLIVLMKVLPRVVLYGVMALVVPFYMLINRAGYRATYRFFRERMGYGPLRSFAGVYANHFVFGGVILDRFAMYAGKTFRFDNAENDLIMEKSAEPGGFIVSSSHVGNYELAGYTLHCSGKSLSALVFAGEKKTVMDGRRKMFSETGISMIPLMEDMSHIYEINRLLDEGQIVSMPCDRIFGSAKFVEAPFFGETARFPMGPFSIAVTKGVPMIAVFSMKTSLKGYRLHARPLGMSGVTRAEKVASLAASYARELEDVLRTYPCQWFNYFDFWKK